ncbi:MAG TPA: threonine/serine dehydratase [Candidatus Sulfomarinibacteraceae bacterium]|nr:threonine/serine dehydratase [Candidatus Sulfomarinibacteraceae bacterium]
MTPGPLVDLAAINAAREVIAGRVHRTPLLSSTAAAAVIERSAGIRIADRRLFLKAEHLQKTGSFKPRGMTARVAALSADERRRGIITFSAGNAAQGYAYAGAALGVPVTVVMPAAAVRSKVDASAGYGARVVLEGENFGAVYAAMERIRDEERLVLCHPFDDPEVVAGHGSAGLEILEDLPDVDVVVVAVGGGGLISGIAAAVKALRPGVRVYGVEPETSDAISQGLAAGHPVRMQPMSVADGLNAPFAGELTLEMIRRYVDGVVLIDDATILAGLRFALERMKQVVEPAGAAALAAVLTGRIPIRDGERVAAVMSGGNVEVTRLGELIDRAAPLA